MAGYSYLNEFIDDWQSSMRQQSSWLKIAGFRTAYVRVGATYLSHLGARVPAVTLANMNASRPGKGAFTALVSHLQQRYPHLYICVENVLTEQFCEGLTRRGFTIEGGEGEGPASFYLEPARPAEVLAAS